MAEDAEFIDVTEAAKRLGVSASFLNKARLVGIVFKDLPDLPDRAVDGIVRVEEGVLSPDFLHNLFAAYQLSPVLHQEEESFHGDSFQLDQPAGAAQLAGS